MTAPDPLFIKIKVHAGSKKEAIVQKTADSFEIWVKEPAERNLANRAALELLGRELKIKPGALRIIKGAHTPGKIIQIHPA